MSAAAAYLKEQLGAKEYADALKAAGVQRLVQAIELFDAEFEVLPGGYYLRRVD
jgi:hypothetical protein